MSFFDDVVAQTGIDPTTPPWQPGDPGPAPESQIPGPWDRVTDLLDNNDQPTGGRQPGDPAPDNNSWVDKLADTPTTSESNGVWDKVKEQPNSDEKFWDNLADKYANTPTTSESKGVWDKVKEQPNSDEKFWDNLLKKADPHAPPSATETPKAPFNYQLSKDTELDGYLNDYANARNGGEPEVAHTGIGASHMGMTTNLANRLDEVGELTKRINPESSSLGINAATNKLATTRSDIFTAANDIQAINKALADYHAEINRYWIDMTAARTEAENLAKEYTTAVQVAGLPPGSVGTGSSNGQEQLVVPGFGGTAMRVPPELRGVTSRTPEAIQQDLTANMGEQRRVIEQFVGAQPPIQSKMRVQQVEVVPRPGVAPFTPGGSGPGVASGNGGGVAAPSGSNGWTGSGSTPLATPATTSSTPSSSNGNANNLEDLLSNGTDATGNGTGVNGTGAQQQPQQPQQMAAMPPYSPQQQTPQQAGTTSASNNPEVLSDGEFNDLLDSIIKDNNAADGSGVVATPTNSGTAGTSLSSGGTPTKPASLVQPPSWMNAQTAGTGESSGTAARPSAPGGASAGTSSGRLGGSGMPMMPMMPPGSPGGGGRADKSDRPKIQNVDPDIYGDDIKTTKPVIGTRPQDRQT